MKQSVWKEYVPVYTYTNEDGVMLPQELIWTDGTHYAIDKVLEIRQAAAMKAGGQGDRYTIMVEGIKTYLFFERSANLTGNVIGRWFVERKSPRPDTTL